VAVEMGGTPLDEFEHPLDAVYLLGSEDGGLPTSVLRACHERVSLRSERCTRATRPQDIGP
jgi:tRNA G18 (ribose-2'-O)-methylase SpoU